MPQWEDHEVKSTTRSKIDLGEYRILIWERTSEGTWEAELKRPNFSGVYGRSKTLKAKSLPEVKKEALAFALDVIRRQLSRDLLAASMLVEKLGE
jgi:hypothetical protein